MEVPFEHVWPKELLDLFCQILKIGHCCATLAFGSYTANLKFELGDQSSSGHQMSAATTASSQPHQLVTEVSLCVLGAEICLWLKYAPN